MAYKFRRGKAELSGSMTTDDVSYYQDTDTQIDWEEDYISFKTNNTDVLTVNGSKVGIGTTAPAEELHVAGDVKVAGNDPRIKIDGDTDSHPGLELYENGTRKWILYNNYANDNLTFKTNSSIRMSIQQDGNVGIGTTTPDYTLDVAGNIGVDQFIYHNGDADTYLNFTNNSIDFTGGGNQLLSLSNKVEVNANGNSIWFAVAADHGEHCIVADTEEGRVGILNSSPGTDFVVGSDTLIVSGSSVGIGSTWSGKELHVTDGDSGTPSAPTSCQVVVESGGNAGISLLAGGSRARVFFGDSSDVDEGWIEYKFTNNERFNIQVAANEVMRIYESGYSNTITTLNGVKTTAGLFTEGHPYYSNDANITVGDCCVLENGQIVRSSSPMQKNVGGIAWYSVLDDLQDPGTSGDDAWPLTLNDNTVSRVAEDALGVQCDMAEQSGGEWVPTAKFQTLWKLAALGDSRQSNYGTTDLTGFKVCNEGGAITTGDLLCTSTTPGYLMKQPDDIMRSYTVGKSMQDVVFDGNGHATGVYGYLYCG